MLGILELLPLTHATHALRAIGGGGEATLFSWSVLFFYGTALVGIGVWTMEKSGGRVVRNSNISDVLLIVDGDY